MRFDVVLGNPPYQKNDGGVRDDGSANASATAIYPNYVESAEKTSEIQSLIIPARWLSGAGKGLSAFSKHMVQSKNFQIFEYYLDSKDVFPNNDIKGGVCYFVKNHNHNGEAKVIIHEKGRSVDSLRFLDENGIGVFIPYAELSKILLKVQAVVGDIPSKSIQTIVSPRNPYGLATDFFKNPSKYDLPDIMPNREKANDIEIFGLLNGMRTSRFVSDDYPITKGLDLVNKYKVFLSYAYGTGSLGEPTAKPVVGIPHTICTETFLNIGVFNAEIEAVNLVRYIKTKFFRVMVGILKTTQHATTTFKYVPLQDFTENSDIDWSKSIPEIDIQLYMKYGLNEEEIEFIETHAKEMIII